MVEICKTGLADDAVSVTNQLMMNACFDRPLLLSSLGVNKLGPGALIWSPHLNIGLLRTTKFLGQKVRTGVDL